MIEITTLADLTAALKAAKGGEGFRLKPGSYPALRLKAPNVATPVTLDLTGVKVAALNLSDVWGLRIFGLEIAFDPAVKTASQVWGGGRLSCAGLRASGSRIATGLQLIGVKDAAVFGSYFSDLKCGVTHSNCDGLNVASSVFRGMAADGISGGGTSRIRFAGNLFTDFAPAEGSHPDAIQLFTKGTGVSAEDIVIEDNVISRGVGGIMQGVFMTDQVGALPYRRVLIRRNRVIGAMHNGIAVQHGENVTVEGNLVQPIDGQASRLNLYDVRDGWVQDNRYWKLDQQRCENLTVLDAPSLAPVSAAAALAA